MTRRQALRPGAADRLLATLPTECGACGVFVRQAELVRGLCPQCRALAKRFGGETR